MKLVVTGGGTGGHVFPALEVARFAREQGAEVLYLGSLRGQERALAPKAGIQFRGFCSEPLYSVRTPRGWRALFNLARATLQARKVLKEADPDALFSTGGYSSAPVVRAAITLGIPFVLHEQNAVPGRSNLLSAKKAKAIATTFHAAATHFEAYLGEGQSNQSSVESVVSRPSDQSSVESVVSRQPNQSSVESVVSRQSDQSSVESVVSRQSDQSSIESVVSRQSNQSSVESVVSRQSDQSSVESVVSRQSNQSSLATRNSKLVTRTGLPVRAELREKAMERNLTMDAYPMRILVVGGSQGAASINEASLQAAQRMTKDVRWLHVTGKNHFETIYHTYEKLGLGSIYEVKAYLEGAEMAAAYSSASVVVGRSGAGTLSELAAFGLPSVLVPYPHSHANHQHFNAREFADLGAATLIPQADLGAAKLEEALLSWLESGPARDGAREALAGWDRPDAAAAIMQLLVDCA